MSTLPSPHFPLYTVLINFLFARTVYLEVDTINPLGMAGV